MTSSGGMMSPVVERAEGRAGGLADLYVRHAPDGIRLAYLLTGDRALAEDLVQDAFGRLIGRLVHLRDPQAFGAYLRKTIVNLSKNFYRRRAIERAYLERHANMRTVDPSQPDVATREAMRAQLLRLPQRQRAAIVLRYYEDLPEAAIADILRCRPGTVRSLLSRAMQSLRTEMRGE